MPLCSSPEAIRNQIRKRYERQRGNWLSGAGDWPLQLPLGAPTEAQARQHWSLFEQWLRDWQQPQFGGQVLLSTRRWPGLGVQSLPQHLQFDDAQAIADALGEGPRWQRAYARTRRLLAQWPELAEVAARQFELLADSADPDFERLLDVLRWLLENPASGYLLRQLPIAGIDSKWIEAGRLDVLRDWLLALRGGAGDFLQVAGLRRAPALLRMRLLDPALRAAVGGLSDLSAPVEQIAALQLPHLQRVLVVENLQTGLACGDLPGTALFLGCGYAVDVLAQILWLQDIPVHYWGDLDSHGLAILHRLRCHLPHARSLLMDTQTLLAHREVWSEESRPSSAVLLGALDKVEQQLFDDLRRGRWGANVRLEQERIAWSYAWPRVLVALGVRPESAWPW